MSQSAGRELALLEHIARSREPRGLMELADDLALDKSTAARLLEDLRQRQLIDRDARTKKFTVGTALVALAGVTLRGSGLITVASPHLEELRDLSGESPSLHIRVRSERICIAGAESRHVIRRVVVVGEPAPLYTGPTGKVLLAFSPPSELPPIIAEAVADGLDRHWLEDRLALIRSSGYMAAIGDRTPNAGAVSVPVFNHRGLVAALTVAGPGDRWSLAAMNAFIPTLLSAASRISRTLGAANDVAPLRPVSW